jgi:KaiC/GvpD/RAD55 family RecA-like ATPase
VTDAEFFAERVAELAGHRTLGDAASVVAALGPDADPAVVQAARARLADVLAGTGPQHGAPAPRRTWRPVNLDSVLDGTHQVPNPSVGTRDDGRGLFYPGRLHVVAAEAEAGKTWFALAAVAEELTFGRACVYLDFEDDEVGIVGRLMSMGLSSQVIRDRFAYIRPEESVEDGVNRRDLTEAIGDLRPSLAVLDGVTEAMSMHGLELKDNTDVAKFGRALPRWIAGLGPAVVTLDHVVKDREARSSGYAIGGVHKLNGLNGAMFLMENRDPFGIGLTGRSRILVRKDRPGQLRRHGVKAHDGLFWYADLVVESHHEDFAEVTLPVPTDGSPATFRPTVIMAKICDALAPVPDGLSKNAIEGAVTGKATTVRYGLELLVSEGYIAVEKAGAAKLHKLTRRFPDE